MRDLFEFPNPVNEVSARLVAGGVVILGRLTIALDQPWLMVVLAYGFVARVLTGPTLSPLGQLVTRSSHRLARRAEVRGRPAQAVRAGDRRDAVGRRGDRLLGFGGRRSRTCWSA